MISELFQIANFVDSIIPKQIKNIKVDFLVKELGLCFVCDDKSVGNLRVSIYDCDGNFLAYIEGDNHEGSLLNIGQNINDYSNDFLFNCFHMSRCLREFNRLDDINYSKGFDYFRKQAIVSSMKNVD